MSNVSCREILKNKQKLTKIGLLNSYKISDYKELYRNKDYEITGINY